MALSKVQADLLDSSIDGDVEKMSAAIDDLGDMGTFQLVAGIFVVVMYRQFSHDPSPQEISAVATKTMSELSGAGLHQVTLEAVIRSVFGDPDALDSLTASEANNARAALNRLYFYKNPMDRANRQTMHAEVAEAMED